MMVFLMLFFLDLLLPPISNFNLSSQEVEEEQRGGRAEAALLGRPGTLPHLHLDQFVLEAEDVLSGRPAG